MVEALYKDYFQARMALVDLIPVRQCDSANIVMLSPKAYPLLYMGWLSDHQLLSLIPSVVNFRAVKHMQYVAMKRRLVRAMMDSPQYRCFLDIGVAQLYHPFFYNRFVVRCQQSTVTAAMSFIDQAVLAIPSFPFVNQQEGAPDHAQAITATIWTDELQAFLIARRIRPSDENTRILYSLFNHQLHNSKTQFTAHPLEPRCTCVDCNRPSSFVTCTCTNCIQKRKQSQILATILS